MYLRINLNGIRSLLTTLVVVSFSVASSATIRMNILFIAVDDLRPELKCYGVDYALSPNLDHFSKSAVTFQNHYVQVPTCGASRYALLTGRSPSNSGALRNNVFYSGTTAIKNNELPGAQTMPELFRRSGYETILIGKISHTPDGRIFSYDGKGDGRREMPRAWDRISTPMGEWKKGWPLFFAYANGNHREDGKSPMKLMEFIVEKDDDLPDGLLADKAINELTKLKKIKRPFFMGLGFFKPHLPFVAPKKDWEAFEKIEIPFPDEKKPFNSPFKHDSGEFFKYLPPYKDKRPLDNKSATTARRAYLACVRYIDRQIGKVLKCLDETELSKNTIVVVWGDHGWHLGNGQQWGKHTPFEIANRSVLMIRSPNIKGGFSTNALAETLDIYPTLLDLCKPQFRQTHHPLDGVSLAPILKKEKKSVRKHAISYWRNAVSVRSQSHRLVAQIKNGEIINKEIYDLKVKLNTTKKSESNNSKIEKELIEAISKLNLN